MSVRTLDKLTMLVLDCCDLNEMSLSIVPENLETLRISDCRIPNPLDLSKLKSLRKLVVLSDSEIEMVSFALSPTLAELHIPGGFKIFDAEGKRSVPISSELNRLTALTSLNIRFEDSEFCPAENIVANLLDFVIHVGIENYFHTRSAMRSIIFKNRCMEGGGEVLVERAEIVILSNVKGSRNGFSNSNNNRESYSNLKKLSIKSCKDMEHLAWIPHYDIKQSQPLTSFSKLSFLHIDSCSKLKYLFCACVAKCLMQLQELHIIDCPTLEFVIQNDCTVDGAIIKFPKLKVLTLKSLQSLRRFCGENTGTSSTSTTIMENAATSPAGSDSLFDEMVAFPALEILTIYSLEKNQIWENNCYKNNSFCQIKCLTVRDCSNLEFAIPVAMLLAFQNLEKLVIYDCDSMTSEVESSSSNESLPELVALRSIDLYNIRGLTNTRLNCKRNFYPKLEILSIRRCNSLRNVFLCSIVKNLVYLKELDVRECEMMSEIIGEGQEEEKTDEFVFPELNKLRLKYLANFKRFCFSESAEALGSTHQHQSYSTPKVSFPKLMKLVFTVDALLEEIEVGKNNSPTEITKLAVEGSKEVELPSKWQLQLPNIEKLYLQNFSWQKSFGEQTDGQYLFNPYGTLSFQKLKSVEVHSCGISALLSCSVFSNLRQLQQLKVTDCPLLEEVVRDENNIVGTRQQIISLLQLKSIQLYNLPKLKSFSRSANYAFNMPALTLVNLDKCPKMENFTCVEISTPSIPDFNSQFQKYLSHPNWRAKIEW